MVMQGAVAAIGCAKCLLVVEFSPGYLAAAEEEEEDMLAYSA